MKGGGGGGGGGGEKLAKTSSKLGRYMKAPMRFLCRARDLYVKSLIDWSGRMAPYVVAAPMGCPAGVVYTLPKSFSVNSSSSYMSAHDHQEDRVDLRALKKVLVLSNTTTTITATTTKINRNIINHNTDQQVVLKGGSCSSIKRSGSYKKLPKSYSVGLIGRIDEDQPCVNFTEDFKVGSSDHDHDHDNKLLLYSRSKSCAHV